MFLRKCAAGEYHDGWVDAGAIQSLKLIAPDRSREILVAALKTNPGRRLSIARALEYIDSKPAPFVGADLHELAARVAQVIFAGPRTTIGAIRCKNAESGALVNLNFETDEDIYVYTATFQYSEGMWRLRGVQESMQALKA